MGRTIDGDLESLSAETYGEHRCWGAVVPGPIGSSGAVMPGPVGRATVGDLRDSRAGMCGVQGPVGMAVLEGCSAALCGGGGKGGDVATCAGLWQGMAMDGSPWQCIAAHGSVAGHGSPWQGILWQCRQPLAMHGILWHRLASHGSSWLPMAEQAAPGSP